MPTAHNGPASFQQVGDALLAIYDLASKAARAGTKQVRRLRPSRNTTLHPGPATPLWNELVKQARAHLGRRGAKARLARYLGVPRQRLQVCLNARRACLDAERTLLLLCWVTARQQGRDLDL